MDYSKLSKLNKDDKRGTRKGVAPKSNSLESISDSKNTNSPLKKAIDTSNATEIVAKSRKRKVLNGS